MGNGMGGLVWALTVGAVIALFATGCDPTKLSLTSGPTMIEMDR